MEKIFARQYVLSFIRGSTNLFKEDYMATRLTYICRELQYAKSNKERINTR